MAAPINLQANITLNPASLNASAKQVQQALGRITGQASEFQKSLDASTARVFAFGATTSVINGVTQSFKSLVSTTVTVQAKLIEINSILGAGAAEFNKYRNAIFNVAKNTGQSFQTVADGAAELARQGLDAAESAKRLEAALILTRISGLGAQDSVKALTAAMNGFTSAGLSATQIVNKIVAVDTAFAVSAQDLAQGFSRAGSTAEDAGVSFEELLGLITAVEQRTARGGAVIGNAFKSIFTRLSRGDTIDQLQELGVAIDAGQSGVQKLQALSKALDSVSDPAVASQIKELAGGVYQINVVSAALKDLSNEASVFGNATDKAYNASNEAIEKNAQLNESLLAQINDLTVSVTAFADRLGGLTLGPLLENVVGFATALSEGLNDALDPEKGNTFVKGLFAVIGKFISGPGLALFVAGFVKIFGAVIKFAKEGFQTIIEMGSATEKLRSVESGIVNLLQKDDKLRQSIGSATLTQEQKQKLIIDAIKTQNGLLATQEKLVRDIAQASMAAGVTGYSEKGFTGKRGKRYAAGGSGQMEPDLLTAMANEARDAPAGAMPYLTTFRGQPAVMNTSELQTKINGREEILTQDQIPRFNDGSNAIKISQQQRQKFKGKKNIGNRYVFLTPKIDEVGSIGPMTVDKIHHPYTHPVRGIQSSQLKGISDKSEDKLEDEIKEMMFKKAADWTSKIKPLDKSAPISEIKKGYDQIGGAKGALNAAIGAAFEVGIKKSLGYEADERDAGGDFDVRGGANLGLIQKLFGITQSVGDMKNSSDSDGNRRSFVKKVRKEVGAGVMTDDEAKRQAAKKTATAMKAAGIKGRTSPAAQKMYDTYLKSARRGGASSNLSNLSKGTIPTSRLKRYSRGSTPSQRYKGLIKRYARGSGPPKMESSIDISELQEMANVLKDANDSALDTKEGIKQLADAYNVSEETAQKVVDTTKKQNKSMRETGKEQGKLARGFSKLKASMKGAAADPMMRGMGLQMLGSTAAAGVDYIGSRMDEKDPTKDIVSAAGGAIQGAATGAMIGSIIPGVGTAIGAGVGALVGGVTSLFESKGAREEILKKEEEERGIQNRKNESMKGALGMVSDRFGGQSIGDVSGRLSQLAKATGKEQFNMGPMLERMQNSFKNVEKGSEEWKRLNLKFGTALEAASIALENADLMAFKENMDRVNQRIDELSKNNAAISAGQQLETLGMDNSMRSSLLGSMGGKFAKPLQDQARMGQAFINTGEARNQVDQLRVQQAQFAPDSEQFKEFGEKIKEAEAKFKESVIQSAQQMGQIMLQNQQRMAELDKQNAELTSKQGVSQFDTLMKQFETGGINLDTAKKLGEDVNKAMESGDTEALKRAMIRFEKYASEQTGSKAERDALIKNYTNFGNVVTAGQTYDQASMSMMQGGTEKERRDLLALREPAQITAQITENSEEAKMLREQAKLAAENLSRFGSAFGETEITDKVASMVGSITDIGENMGKFKDFSSEIAGLGTKVSQIISQNASLVEADVKTMEKLAEEKATIQKGLDTTIQRLESVVSKLEQLE